MGFVAYTGDSARVVSVARARKASRSATSYVHSSRTLNLIYTLTLPKSQALQVLL